MTGDNEQDEQERLFYIFEFAPDPEIKTTTVIFRRDDMAEFKIRELLAMVLRHLYSLQPDMTGDELVRLAARTPPEWKYLKTVHLVRDNSPQSGFHEVCFYLERAHKAPGTDSGDNIVAMSGHFLDRLTGKHLALAGGNPKANRKYPKG